MARAKSRPKRPVNQLPKSPTGIQGLDEITGGGLPQPGPTLVCGAAGCGKTLLAAEFLVRGAVRNGEPGVFLAFEETAEELAHNVAWLGFDLVDLTARGLLRLDHVRVERSEIEETGEYDLEGLFLRLGHAATGERGSSGVERLDAMRGGRATAGVPTSWSRARPARASRAWRPTSCARPAAGASGCCTSPSRRGRPRSCATGGCTSSSRAAWPTPTRSASSA